MAASKIQQKKKDKSSKNSSPNSKKNDFYGFFKSLSLIVFFLLIWTFVSSGIIANIQHYNRSPYLKTSVEAIRKGFPLQGELVQQKGDFMDWLMNTVAMTFSKNNSIMVELLQYFNDGFSVIQGKRAANSGENNIQNQLLDKSLEQGIMSVYYLFSPLILLGLPFLGYVIGFFGLIYNGLINGGLLTGDLVNKIFGFFVFLFGLPVLTGVYEFFGNSFYMIFNSYNVLKSGVQLKNVANIIRQNVQLIMFIFTIGVIISAFKNLSNSASIGITVGFIIINIIPILHFLINM